jgi:A/G-specific adenine glycosylase
MSRVVRRAEHMRESAPARQHRLSVLRRTLLAWYDRHQRRLPWRSRRPVSYHVWLSEVMLQQTRVQTVIPYYRRFLLAFPTVADLAAAPLDQVLKLWEGLGYYTRARQLHAAARRIVTPAGVCWPRTAQQWQELPGVGRYTAAAIASITRGEPVAVLDGNVKRVLARVSNFTAAIDRPAHVTRLWQMAERLLDRDRPGDFNQALMEVGATVCLPRRPRCAECPWRSACAARAAGHEQDLPRRSGRRVATEVEAVAVVIQTRGRWLMVQRPPSGQLGGYWQLPGGPVANGENSAAAAARVLNQQMGRPVRILRTLGMVEHAFTHRRLRVHVLEVCWQPRADGQGVGAAPTGPAARRWVPAAELEQLPLARLDQKIIALARAGLQQPHGHAGRE